ncbi:MAG: pyridoxal-phosphate dependent enzyme, partial [Actinomycetota bacterium]|nr:pyridoxal-phosphate dependent enzyme [Actinomycetota bacterium]
MGRSSRSITFHPDPSNGSGCRGISLYVIQWLKSRGAFHVMLYTKPYEISGEQHFLILPELIRGSETYLKLEGVNPAGSIKLKAAVAMVADAEACGRLGPRGHIIESSSGSLGVALAMIAAAKDYSFTCVVDPNVSRTSLA